MSLFLFLFQCWATLVRPASAWKVFILDLLYNNSGPSGYLIKNGPKV